MKLTNNQVAIYELIDPDTLQKRYVGKSNDVEKRLNQHMDPKGINLKYYADRWKMSMIRRGVIPILEIIEIVDENQWKERERFWIKTRSKEGHPLTNTAPGGFGGICSAEHMSKIIKRNKERIYSPENRRIRSEKQKLRRLQRKLSGEVNKYSLEGWKSLSQKSSKNMVDRRAAGWTPPNQGVFLAPEKLSDMMKKIWADRKVAGYVSKSLGQKRSLESRLKMSKSAKLRRRN